MKTLQIRWWHSILLCSIIPHNQVQAFEYKITDLMTAGLVTTGAAIAGYYLKKYYDSITKVAVIIFDQPVMHTGPVMEKLLALHNDDSFSALFLIVESGGGAAGQAENLYHLISQIALKKPVIVSVIDTCASGAYLMACPATAIVAPAMSMIGCIGVNRTLIKSFPEKFDGEGASGSLTVHPFSAGKYKSMHNEHAPMTEEQEQQAQEEIDAIYDAFVHLVAQARGLDPEQKEMWAEGKCFSGAQAVAPEIGLIDYLGGIPQGIAVVKQELAKRALPVDNIHWIRI